jgi:hypothetical protein
MWPGMCLQLKFRSRSMWLLSIFAAFTLLFFAISTNQEYYTWPAWIPMIIMTAGVLASMEQAQEGGQPWGVSRGWTVGAQVVYAAVGVAVAGRWAGDCGSRARCRLWTISGRCWRIAAWRITRFRCRISSI